MKALAPSGPRRRGCTFKLLEQGKVKEIVIGSREIQGELSEPVDGKQRLVTTRVEPALVAQLEAHEVTYTGRIENTFFSTLLWWVVPVLIFFGICVLLMRRMGKQMGGRVAKQVIFGHLSTGASDDLARVTDTARSMATRSGLVPERGQPRRGRRGCLTTRVAARAPPQPPRLATDVSTTMRPRASLTSSSGSSPARPRRPRSGASARARSAPRRSSSAWPACPLPTTARVVLQQCGAMSNGACTTRIVLASEHGISTTTAFVNPINVTLDATNVYVDISNSRAVWAYWTPTDWGCSDDADSNCNTGSYRALAWR